MMLSHDPTAEVTIRGDIDLSSKDQEMILFRPLCAPHCATGAVLSELFRCLGNRFLQLVLAETAADIS